MFDKFEDSPVSLIKSPPKLAKTELFVRDFFFFFFFLGGGLGFPLKHKKRSRNSHFIVILWDVFKNFSVHDIVEGIHEAILLSGFIGRVVPAVVQSPLLVESSREGDGQLVCFGDGIDVRVHVQVDFELLCLAAGNDSAH